jgi:uncharacterized protein YndB with AHSA1/START domain
VTKTIQAPVSRVYDAFTTATALDDWFGRHNRIHLQAGGTLANDDGNRATLLKVRPAKSLVLHWDSDDLGAATEVELLFQEKGAKCGLVINHTRIQNRHTAEVSRATWESALSSLKRCLEQGTGGQSR